MQIYFFDPDEARHEATSAQLQAEGANITKVDEPFFNGDMAAISLESSKTRCVLISLDERIPATTLAKIREIRRVGCHNPIIILRNSRQYEASNELMDAGADDVIPRPARASEIMTRFNAISRRNHGHSTSSIEIGKITAFLDGRDPEVDGKRIKLTQREHAIFTHLALNKGRVISKNGLYDAIYAEIDSSPYDKTIDVYICKLRKILRNETGQKYIETVYGRGYMINDPDPAEEQQQIAADAKPLLLESFDVKTEMQAEEIQTEAYVG